MLKQFLAIDTATDACTVALMCNGTVMGESVYAPKKHAELLLPKVADLLKHAQLPLSDLNGIVVGEGPGSFTGIRMALSVAQGLSMASGVITWQISTLLATALSSLSYPLMKDQNIIVAIDARMGQVYAQAFTVKDEHIISCSKPCLDTLEGCLPQLLASLPEKSTIAVGNGFAHYQSQWTDYKESFTDCLENTFPNALKFSTHIYANPTIYARKVEIFSEVRPTYIRNQVADVSAKQILSSKA